MKHTEPNKYFSTYTLQVLVQDYAYSTTSSYEHTDDVIASLNLEPLPQNELAIIGINGPTCAGKTSFTDQLVADLESRNIPVVRIGFDWFLYDRSKRNTLVEQITQNHKTIEEVTRTAWDIERYDGLLRLLKSFNKDKTIPLLGLYDRMHGSQTANMEITIPYGGYAIIEGVGILDTDSIHLIDKHIRLDVDDDEVLIKRAIARENVKSPAYRLSEEFLRHRFEVMDLQHMRYLRKISRGHNQLIVDVSDFNNIKTYSR